MSIGTRNRQEPLTSGESPLINGDRMTQPEFHRAYEAYPGDEKFELIGGTVYRASPLRRAHAKNQLNLLVILEQYERETPGIELLDNATTILGEASEPQPDLALRIMSAFGGQSQENSDDYVVGAPELIAEIAHSTRAIDLHQKREDYRGAGVQEYIVLCVRERELYWFDFNLREPISPDRKGVSRSRVFPGLWINISALLAGRRREMIDTVRAGLASAPHTAFVKHLRSKLRKKR